MSMLKPALRNEIPCGFLHRLQTIATRPEREEATAGWENYITSSLRIFLFARYC
jgi:hypothetical protein